MIQPPDKRPGKTRDSLLENLTESPSGVFLPRWNVMKMKQLFFIAFMVFAASLVSARDNRREEWPIVKGASATIGSQKVGVFSDPNRPTDILLFPGCWLIQRTEKRVLQPNCSFNLIHGALIFDPTWRDKNGRLSGVLWNDPKTEISLFSILFRRPKFKDTQVKFWTGSSWATTTNLPPLK